jgi:hypothetical protein
MKEVTSVGSSHLQNFEFDRSKKINEGVKREGKKAHGFVNTVRPRLTSDPANEFFG